MNSKNSKNIWNRYVGANRELEGKADYAIAGDMLKQTKDTPSAKKPTPRPIANDILRNDFGFTSFKERPFSKIKDLEFAKDLLYAIRTKYKEHYWGFKIEITALLELTPRGLDDKLRKFIEGKKRSAAKDPVQILCKHQ